MRSFSPWLKPSFSGWTIETASVRVASLFTAGFVVVNRIGINDEVVVDADVVDILVTLLTLRGVNV